MNKIIPIILLLHATVQTYAQDAAISLEIAESYFTEIKEICKKDNGNLWGINLYGKMLFVDPKSRTIVANQQNKLKTFRKKGMVFIGKLEKEVNIANTATDLYDEKWTMLNWDHIPQKDHFKRNWLLIHESWHRVQADIGLPPSWINIDNNHLDTFKGRIYLKLEWRALRKALLTNGSKRREAIKDALIFRNYRHNLFENAQKNECRFEMHEGLAEYTGAKLAGYQSDTLLTVLEKRMKNAENQRSFNWAFAYQNGPAYGILLDELGTEWRSKLEPTSDFGKIIKKVLSIQLPENLKDSVESIYTEYNGEELIKTEKEYEEKQRKLRKHYINIFIKAPTLSINLVNYEIGFNPYDIFPLDEHGKVYKTARIVDEWGILKVERGLLMDKNCRKIKVSAPLRISEEKVEGDGWVLKLNENWEVISHENGDFTLKRRSK